MKINDLIFKELLKRGFIKEGKTRVWNIADSKLWYLTQTQTQGFLNLEKAVKYKKEITNKEIGLIVKYLSEITKKIKNDSYNIIDLGCGSGEKAALLIKKINKLLKLRYCPIDISSFMVNQAAKTIRALKLSEVIEFKWNVSDFENLDNILPLLREEKTKKHLLLLLGNTLGNFDKDDILHGIRTGMKKGDLLLIGNGLNNSSQNKILEPYRDELLDKFLIKTVEQIGFKPSNIEYDVRFENSRVEMMYHVKADKTINHLNRKIKFFAGDIILVAISYKYSQDSLSVQLKKLFHEVSIFTDTKKTYAIALCII